MTSALPPDPWKVLGVDKAADKSDIRTAYKKLVLKCHPDKVQDPTLKAKKQEEFQKVQQAYELLNDDAARAKYEQKAKLADLQRAAKVQQEARHSPNTSVPRTSSRYAAYDIRTAEPTSRYTSSPSSGGKVYTHYTTTHTRSHEEVPSSRVYTLYEESEKQARRTASYEIPSPSSRKDEERREREKEERRRKKQEEIDRIIEIDRLHDREKTKQREYIKAQAEEEYRRNLKKKQQREEEINRIIENDRAHDRLKDEKRERERAELEKEMLRAGAKAEKKRLDKERERLDKERERERKRDAEDKARRHKPYVEPYAADAYGEVYLDELYLDDEKYVSGRSDKKRSSSRKHDETREREREKSSSRRAKSPHHNPDDSLDRKTKNTLTSAATYIMLSKSQTSQSSYLPHPAAPTPPPHPSQPPLDFEEESIRHASARAAGRRASNDAARSREKLRTYDLDNNPATPTATTTPVTSGTPKSARPIPTLKQAYSTPPPAPESPPQRVSRSQTVPHDIYARPIPSLQRNQTWAPGSGGLAGMTDDRYYDDYDSEDDRDRRHRRSSGRDRERDRDRDRDRERDVLAAAATHRYKVEGGKTSKLDSAAYAAVYGATGESPTSRRYATSPGGLNDGVAAATTYQGTPFRVKEAKSYGPADVKYSEYAPQPPSYYAGHGGDGYPVMA